MLGCMEVVNQQGKIGRRIRVDQRGFYRIMVQGRLNEASVRQFEGLEAVTERDGAGNSVTTFTGIVADQAALHGLIARIRDLGVPLLLVELVTPVA
jgi:hypothetical protein